ncbi:MAG TPA: VWA domain-containing protein, partial [Acidisarcina sp.]
TLLVCGPVAACGQTPQSGATTTNVPAMTPPPVFSTRTTLVLIPALVTTRSGEPVFTLSANDFNVTDDQAPQKIALEEETGGEPLALVVDIQTGGAGGARLPNYSNLPALIEAVVGNVEHKIAVVTFDESPQTAQDFTSDFNKVSTTISTLTAGNGGAAILDSLALSVEILRRQPANYRRAILLVSETVDHGSQVRLNEALRMISDTNTAIYSFAFSSSRADLKHEASNLNQDTPGPPGGCMSRDPDKDPDPTDSRLSQTWECLSQLAPPLRLAKMAALVTMNGLRRNVPETVAQVTGGEYFHAENARSLERGLLTLANHLPNRYVLSFHPQSPRPGLHVLRVQLNDYPKLAVAARTSYWADASPTQVAPSL